jgi:hypothetical protein
MPWIFTPAPRGITAHAADSELRGEAEMLDELIV